MTSDITDIYNTDYLKDLRKRIMNLQDNEYYEILKIIIKYDYNFSENKNGIFINMSKLNNNVISEIEKLIDFCESNKIRLQNDMIKRNNLLQIFK